MRLATGKPGDLIVDTDEALDATSCSVLRNAGIRGVVRYASDLTVHEVDTIIGAGLILYFVNHSRNPGWLPSAIDGKKDANRDLADLLRLGIPKGVHMAFDLEGVGGGSPSNVIAHVNAHAGGIQAGGYLASLYVGYGALLNSVQLYALRSTLYWHSCSRIVDMAGAEAAPECGWAMMQISPPNINLFGVIVDYNVVMQDFSKRLPVGVAA